MTYAKVLQGIVVKIQDTGEDPYWVFHRKPFIIRIRIDQLEIPPEVGWTFSFEEGFKPQE